jgi:hypothetical protein
MFKLTLKNLIICALAPLLISAAFAQAPPPRVSAFLRLRIPISPTPQNQAEPDFSGAGRPGRQTSGESRSDCSATDTQLTALMPVSNWGTTTAARPTFWFYVPYTPQQAPSGEFVLQDESRQDIARIPLKLPDTPGFLGFELPSSQASLTVDRWYRWYFKLYCDRQKTSSPIFVQGWIQRIALTGELEQQLEKSNRKDLVYRDRQIWYDAIAYLANLRLANPRDPTLEEDWNRLLKAKGVELKLPNSKMLTF